MNAYRLMVIGYLATGYVDQNKQIENDQNNEGGGELSLFESKVEESVGGLTMSEDGGGLSLEDE